MPKPKTIRKEKDPEEKRLYNRLKKAESRQRLRDEGKCIIRFAGCEGDAIQGGVTCASCNSVRQEKANEAGWEQRPSRIVVRLRQKGLSIEDVIAQSGQRRSYVLEVLERHGLR